MRRQTFLFGAYLLDPERGLLLRDGAPVPIGNRGLQLLCALLKAPGQVLTKAELMDAAWSKAVVEESNLSVQIASLRKLLGPSPEGGEWIATVPRIGYRFVGPVQQDAIDAADQAAELGRRPSIAVLPFSNLSGDPAQEHFADGITEDIIAALSRFRWFYVAARNSSFAYKGRPINVKLVAQDLGARYVLEGSVRNSSRPLRVSAQLSDAASGNQILANKYDFDLVDVLAVQDQIAERVAGAVEPELLKSEAALAATRLRGANPTAWDLVRQGLWYLQQVAQESHLRSRDLFREACNLDPDLPEGPIWLAQAAAGMLAYGWSDAPANDAREGLNAARRAIQMDEKNPYAHCALAMASAYGDAPEDGIRAAEKAIELCSSLALGHLLLGTARLFCGDASGAIAPLERGLELNPYDAQSFSWYSHLALAYSFDGEPDAALQCAERALKIRPAWRSTLETAACCCVALGRAEAAREYLEQMARLDESSGDALAPLKRRNPRWEEAMATLLRKAEALP